MNILNAKTLKLLRNLEYVKISVNGDKLYEDWEFKFDFMQFLDVIEYGNREIKYHIIARRGDEWDDDATWLFNSISSSVVNVYSMRGWNIAYKTVYAQGNHAPFDTVFIASS